MTVTQEGEHAYFNNNTTKVGDDQNYLIKKNSSKVVYQKKMASDAHHNIKNIEGVNSGEEDVAKINELSSLSKYR